MLANIDPAIFTLMGRFFMDLGFLMVLMVIYYRVNRNSQFLFNFIIFNVLIFFVSSLLSRIQLEAGFAFGLFAIFSVLKYRTEPIPIKEMTFLFTSIITGAINSTVTANLELGEVLFANIMILLLVALLEKIWLKNYKPYQKVLFERIDLIQEGKKDELISELELRMGVIIYDVEIQEIDFLKDTASLKVFTE